MKIALKNIRLDGGTQAREGVNAEYVHELAEFIDQLPPVIVYFDGKDHWLADGFHRYYAHAEKRIPEIKADVRTGTVRDAILFAVGANATHGLRRTNADKRRVVEMMLRDPEWSKRSDRWIAEACGVSHPLVSDIRNEQIEHREGKDGKVRRQPTTARDGRVGWKQVESANALTETRATGVELEITTLIQSALRREWVDVTAPVINKVMAEGKLKTFIHNLFAELDNPEQRSTEDLLIAIIRTSPNRIINVALRTLYSDQELATVKPLLDELK